MNIMFGSQYKSQDVRIAKFKSFLKKRKSSNTRTAKQLMTVAPYTAGTYLYKDDIARRKKETESDIDVKPTRESEKKRYKDLGFDLTDEQLDKLKFIERKHKERTGSDRNFIPGHEIDGGRK